MSVIPRLYRALRGLTTQEGVPRGLYQPKVRRRAALAIADTQGLLLDVGCGRGFVLEEIFPTAPGLELVGVDCDLQLLRTFTRPYLESHGGPATRLVGARAECLPFSDRTFDVVCCLNTLYNLPSLTVVKTFLLEMSRVLKVGGRCLIDIRNRWNLTTSLRFKLVRWHDASFPHPLKTYSAAELKTILPGTGLRILRQYRIGLLKSPFCPVIVFELEKVISSE